MRRTFYRCRRCAVFSHLTIWLACIAWSAMALALACGQTDPVVPPTRDQLPRESHLAEQIAGTVRSERANWAEKYYRGYLAEILDGDIPEARAAYESIIAEAGGKAPQVAARAALRLAELEALAGQRRTAIELMARASVLGRANLDIVEQADRLQARLGSVRAADAEVRGPPMGTRLEGVSELSRTRFAHAETLLSSYYRIRLRPRLEKLRAGVRTKENAMENAVRAYRQVISSEEPAARVAAEFRIASLYHDLALSLMFDLPPELEPGAAAKLESSLRSSALGYLERARTAYTRSVEAYGQVENIPSSKRWSAAAAQALQSVEDLLGGTE